MPIPESESECKICHEVDTHYTRDCPQNVCFRCKQRGHWSMHCPSIKCNVCGETGHKASACQKQCEVCFKTGHKTEDCRHKNSGVTFIQNPMKKRARDVSPSWREKTRRRQTPNPQTSEAATESKSKALKVESRSDAENLSKLDTQQTVKSPFKSPPTREQTKRRQTPRPKDSEEAPKSESKTSKEDSESNAEKYRKPDAQQMVKSLFKSPPMREQRKQRQTPRPKDSEEAPKPESKISKEYSGSNEGKSGKLGNTAND